MKKRSPLRAVHLVFLAAGLCLAAPAQAQVDDRVVAAEAMFQEGKQLVEAGRFAEAAEKFAGSYKLDKAWGPLFNLAHCHEQVGKTATAWAEFREAVAISAIPERKDLARERAQKLEPALVKLRFFVVDKTPGLTLSRNGSVVDPATWETALPVDPGSYTIEARAPEKVSWRSTLRVEGPGQVIAVHVPRLEDVPVPFFQQHRASTIVAGGAVVLAGAGTGMGAWATAIHGTVGTKCAGLGGRQCDTLDAVQSPANAATGLFVAAGAAAVTSAILFFVVERKKSRPPTAGQVSGSPLGISVRF